MPDAEPKHTRPQRITATEFHALAGRRSPPGKARRPRRPARDYPEHQPPFRLNLPFLPPSVNKLFTTVRDPESGVVKRVLTRQARKVRRLITAMVNAEYNPHRLYEMRIDVFLPAFTRKGKVRRVDLTNRVKFLEDCICEAIGIDDSHIFRTVLNKHDSTDESTTVEIRETGQQRGERAA